MEQLKEIHVRAAAYGTRKNGQVSQRYAVGENDVIALEVLPDLRIRVRCLDSDLDFLVWPENAVMGKPLPSVVPSPRVEDASPGSADAPPVAPDSSGAAPIAAAISTAEDALRSPSEAQDSQSLAPAETAPQRASAEAALKPEEEPKPVLPVDAISSRSRGKRKK